MSVTRKHVPDEFEYYFSWKEDVDTNTLPLPSDPKDNLTARRLSRRLSLSPSMAMSDFDLEGVHKNNKIPSNREVDIINKWKEVDQADDDLEKVREAHVKKLRQYDERWRQIERGQLIIKQNLVKFNNFIKEKRLKIEDGAHRSKKHSQVFKLKQQEATRLTSELQQLRTAKTELERVVG